MARKRRMARILLVDESSVVRRSLRHLFEDDIGTTVSAAASNGARSGGSGAGIKAGLDRAGFVDAHYERA